MSGKQCTVDLDEMPSSAVSYLGLYCLLRPVCPNIYGKYSAGWTILYTKHLFQVWHRLFPVNEHRFEGKFLDPVVPGIIILQCCGCFMCIFVCIFNLYNSLG